MNDRTKHVMEMLIKEIADNRAELSAYITKKEYGKAAFLDGYIYGLEYAVLALDPLDGTRVLLDEEVELEDETP